MEIEEHLLEETWKNKDLNLKKDYKETNLITREN
jgi:hypothetical protein